MFSRRSRGVTAKKSTKKRVGRGFRLAKRQRCTAFSAVLFAVAVVVA